MVATVSWAMMYMHRAWYGPSCSNHIASYATVLSYTKLTYPVPGLGKIHYIQHECHIYHSWAWLLGVWRLSQCFNYTLYNLEVHLYRIYSCEACRKRNPINSFTYLKHCGCHTFSLPALAAVVTNDPGDTISWQPVQDCVERQNISKHPQVGM